MQKKGYKYDIPSTNYNIGVDIPYHIIGHHSYSPKVILVYHWGNVYYYMLHGRYQQGMLLDIYTKEALQYAQLKHCAPIFNKQTKEIV